VQAAGFDFGDTAARSCCEVLLLQKLALRILKHRKTPEASSETLITLNKKTLSALKKEALSTLKKEILSALIT
jgi:hypothetical protein